MNVDPGKFFIGVVDLFSILMPGSLLTYVWWIGRSQLRFGEAPHLAGTEQWLVFFFVSYLLGHFAFLLGAVLDDVLYEPLRKATYWGQIQRLATSKNLSPRWLRALVDTRWLFRKNADAAVMQAQRIKARALHDLSADRSINAYQYSKAYLSKEHPPGLVTVQRFEADSKFFRSFVVVLATVAITFVSQRRYDLSWICVALMLPAAWRYVDQRFKGTQHAYWFMIMLEAMNDHATTASMRDMRDGFTHAGGVVFLRQGRTVKWLLVEASAVPDQWVLPKGHIEAGEEPEQTAVREIEEETRCWARVLDPIGTVEIDADKVQFFLMEYLDVPNQESSAVRRGHQWLVIDAAKEKASFVESKELLEKANSKVPKDGAKSSR